MLLRLVSARPLRCAAHFACAGLTAVGLLVCFADGAAVRAQRKPATVTPIAKPEAKPAASPAPNPPASNAAPATADNDVAAKDKEPETPILWCDAEYARTLLEQQITASKKVFDSAQRIRILLSIAPALWEEQNDRARGLFQETFELSLANYEGRLKTERDNRMPNSFGQNDYRYETVRSIARLDAKWAQTLTQKIIEQETRLAAEHPADQDDLRRRTETSDRLLRGATGLVDSDRQSALTLARAAFRYPVNAASVGFFLQMLMRADRAAADALCAEYLQIKSTQPLGDLLAVAGYVFATNRPLALNSFSPPIQQPYAPNPELQRALVEAVLQRAQQLLQSGQAASPPSSDSVNRKPSERAEIVYFLTQTQPLLAQPAPELAARAQQIRETLQNLNTAQERQRMEMQDRVAGMTGSDHSANMRKMAEQARTPEQKNQFLAFYVMQGTQTEPLAELESAAREISEEILRARMLDFIYLAFAERASQAGKFDEAILLGRKIGDETGRAAVLIRTAVALRKADAADKRILDLLAEAESLSARNLPPADNAQVLLLLTEVLTEIDAPRAVTTLRSAVNNLNRADIEQEKRPEEKPDANPSPEAQIRNILVLLPSLITRRTELPRTASVLARKTGSFEPTIAALQDVRNEGIRTQAIAFIAGGCLRADIEIKRKQKAAEKQRALQRSDRNAPPQN